MEIEKPAKLYNLQTWGFTSEAQNLDPGKVMSLFSFCTISLQYTFIKAFSLALTFAHFLRFFFSFSQFCLLFPSLAHFHILLYLPALYLKCKNKFDNTKFHPHLSAFTRFCQLCYTFTRFSIFQHFLIEFMSFCPPLTIFAYFGTLPHAFTLSNTLSQA